MVEVRYFDRIQESNGGEFDKATHILSRHKSCKHLPLPLTVLARQRRTLLSG